MSREHWQRHATQMSRRQLLQAISAAGLAGAGVVPSRVVSAPGSGRQLVSEAAAVKPAGSDLGAIEHVVFLMMENRSYDHYFGSYHRGRGFDDHPADSLGNFAQAYAGGGDLTPAKVLLPFHLSAAAGEDCTTDLTHDWGPQHECWNLGKMDRFVKVHTSAANEGPNGAMTMGYYTRQDLGFYYALADAFTLCDGYHCSILGPTHPNRLMANTGTIDPAGLHGGPVTDTNPSPEVLWSCEWTTSQELLEDAGVSWKVYHPSNLDLDAKYAHLLAYPTWNPVLYDPTLNPEVMLASDHVLPYMKAFQNPSSVLHQKAFGPSFPGDFVSDVMTGSLPSVSWLIPPLGFDEHPSSSPQRGMYFTSLVLDALTANPEVWAKTVFFLMYDENDGWFDHVTPPFPLLGMPGEYLTTKKALSSETLGNRGPLGLGVRVPMLVMSPFSRGGHIASEVFDHTSQLQFLHERFGIEVPNVSAWRRDTVGDLTSTLFQSPTNAEVPALPTVPLALPPLTGTCEEVAQDSELGGSPPIVPRVQRMPTQRDDLA
jgi:phospholipase C